MKKISVAVPIYNAADSLDIMFDSLMNQSMNLADFEVICVNDCSTDNSKEIIEKYSRIMGNVVLIDRTENAGAPATPRNQAIDVAQGEYIHFLDSDDFLGEEALERLYNAARKNNSDVIFGKYVGVNGRSVPTAMFNKGNLDNADLLSDNLVYTLAPHKMVRTSFLKEHNLKFDPKAISGNEDQLFIMQCYVAATVITVLADYDYYYVVSRGEESLSRKFVPAKHYFVIYPALMDSINNFVRNDQYKRRIKVAFITRWLQMSRWPGFLLSSSGFNAGQKKEWLSELAAFVNGYLDDQLIHSLKPKMRQFLEVARENRVERLAELNYTKFN